jgi:hypothetical protein
VYTSPVFRGPCATSSSFSGTMLLPLGPNIASIRPLPSNPAVLFLVGTIISQPFTDRHKVGLRAPNVPQSGRVVNARLPLRSLERFDARMKFGWIARRPSDSLATTHMRASSQQPSLIGTQRPVREHLNADSCVRRPVLQSDAIPGPLTGGYP